MKREKKFTWKKVWPIAGEVVYYLLVICLIVLFTFVAADKLMRQHQFGSGIAHTRLFPGAWVPYLAFGIPIACGLVSLFLGLSFIWTRWQQPLLWVYLGLMGLFTVFCLTVLNLNKLLPCTSLGLMDYWSWLETFWVNVGITGITGLAIWLGHKSIVAAIGNENLKTLDKSKKMV